MRKILFLTLAIYLFASGHIFVYHRFGDNRYKSANTSIQDLKNQFEYLKKHNYKVVLISDMVKRIKENKDIPDNWVAFSIDDGYKSFYKNGLKLFKEYNYPFSLFVYVEATNRHYGDYMTWEQIKEVSKYGEIGLHSYSHPRLVNLTNDDIRKDTKKAFDLFVKKLGFLPVGYAYPYGEYDDRIKNIIKSFKFDYILNQTIGSVEKDSDIYDLNRIALTGYSKNHSNIKYKLRYKSIKVDWIEPKVFPKDGVLKHVKAKLGFNVKWIWLYITGEGWQRVKVKNGILDYKCNIYLKNSRTRIIIGKDMFRVATKLIIKG